MQQFQYTYLKLQITVRTGKELFEAKWLKYNIQINSHQLIGFAVAIPPQMTNLIFIRPQHQNIEQLENIKKYQQTYGLQLIVAYEDHGKRKAKYIPLNAKDPQCLAMINQIKNDHLNKFIGIGAHQIVLKKLGVSIFKDIILAVTIGLLIGAAFIAYQMRDTLFTG